MKKAFVKPLLVLTPILLTLSLNQQMAIAQTAVTQLNATYTNEGGDTSGNYNIEGILNSPTVNDHNFNTSPQNNLRLTSFDLSGDRFRLIRLVNQININRVDNINVTGRRELLFYERDSSTNLPNLNLRPSAAVTMEEGLLSDFINRGTDNVFANEGNARGNNNNIERIDFVETAGLSVATAAELNNIGFLVMERGGNDNFKIAAITAIDAAGRPTAFGPLISVSGSQWGLSSFNFATDVMRKDPSDANLRLSDSVNPQTISAIFFTYANLGITANQVFYGYALFPPDVNSSNDLIGLSNFPTNTPDGFAANPSDTFGGLDLVAGGGIFALDTLLISDLEISKTDGLTSTSASSPISYTITVTNNGPVTVNSLTVTDSLPTNIENVTYTPSSGSYDSNTGVWTGLNLVSGQSVTLQINGTVSATATVGETITNTATVSPPPGIVDPIPGNNTSTDTTTIAAPSGNPQVLLVKRITAVDSNRFTDLVDGIDDINSPNYVPSPFDAHDNDPDWPSAYLQGRLHGGTVHPGNQIEYTIYFLSTGSVDAPKVLICDRIPEDVSFLPTAFNSAPVQAGSLVGADRGIVLSVGPESTSPVNPVSLTNTQDGDVGQYFPPGVDPTTVYPNINCNGANTNGAIVVNLGDLPYATSSGTPSGSYGFIRFRGSVK